MTAIPAAAGIVLRPAQRGDVPTLLAFIRELAAYEKLEHQVVATPALMQQALFGERPAAEVVIAEADGQAAGFVLFFTTFSTFVGLPGLYLEDLFVRPAFRQRGIATTLMRHLARTAVERGCGRFEWSVLDWNEPAIRFYRSLGAQPMAEWTVQRVDGEALLALAGSAQTGTNFR